MDPDQAKYVVRRFNEEVIGAGDRAAFDALMALDFINHSAPTGAPDGPESMWNTFQNVLRPALAGMSVLIHDQIAEGDKVTTRKTISGRHVGSLLGVDATGRSVDIDVIDIVRIVNGRYAEHWGINNLPSILASLRQP